jgi:hypothetical protein
MFPIASSGLIRKHWTSVERLAQDKYYSLLQTLVKYGRKKFHNNVLWTTDRIVGVINKKNLES